MNNLSKFLPTPEMQAEFAEYKQLANDAQRAEFQERRAARINNLPYTQRQAYQADTETALNATVEAAEEFIAMHKLGNIAQAVSLAYIAKEYFGKSKEWLYQRLNGYKVNGKPATFTDAEKQIFAHALRDLGAQLQKTSLQFA